MNEEWKAEGSGIVHSIEFGSTELLKIRHHIELGEDKFT